MNILILLLSLLSPYFSASAQDEAIPAAGFTVQQPVMLAFGHALSPTSYISSFDSLSGVSLYMPEAELLLAKGTPQHIASDPWLDCLEYQYPDISAGVCDGTVLYVHASPAQAKQFGLKLNDRQLNPATMTLKEMIGPPDFVAEDGDVYIRGSAALKIYRDTGTSEWTGIDLFDGNSS